MRQLETVLSVQINNAKQHDQAVKARNSDTRIHVQKIKITLHGRSIFLNVLVSVKFFNLTLTRVHNQNENCTGTDQSSESFSLVGLCMH